MIRSDMKRIIHWDLDWSKKAIAAAETRQRGTLTQVYSILLQKPKGHSGDEKFYDEFETGFTGGGKGC